MGNNFWSYGQLPNGRTLGYAIEPNINIQMMKKK
jgi:hypothetical protein